MNIEIKRITNGWLLIISTPSQAEATYYPEHEECLAKIQKVMSVADNNLGQKD